MATRRRDLLRWQFDLTWALFEYHLQRLEPDDLLWEPADRVWTIRRDPDGHPTPDWEDTEPDPVPVPTIAWLMWHIGWWWGVALDHAEGRPPRSRREVRWPGETPGAVATWLGSLRADWTAVLDRLDDDDLDVPARFPVADDPGVTVGHMAARVNAELMKNVAEIGQLRLVHAAT